MGHTSQTSLDPIVLLSIIYRCWASLRARQMLQQIEPFIHADAHVFFYHHVSQHKHGCKYKRQLKLHFNPRLPLAGIGTDFVKAFNCIQRKPLWFLADVLGIPDGLLGPWQEFAAKFTRRFLVCNQVSDPVLSSQGFAEGCPFERPGNGFGGLGAPDIPTPICSQSASLFLC